ncbi:MAG: IS3 family transposase [Verrucomicrobiota bacterium]
MSENTELKKLVADQMLKIRVLEEVNAENGEPSAQVPSAPGSGGTVSRSSGCYQNKARTDWLLRLHRLIDALSRQHPRLGYRKLTPMLRAEGWKVGKKLVQRPRRGLTCGWSGGCHGSGAKVSPSAPFDASQEAQPRLKLGLRGRSHR